MIGIIPAGGKATRIHGIPKWLLPTPHGTLVNVLIQRMQLAEPRKIVIISKGVNTALLHHTALPDVAIIDRDDTSMAHAVMLAREYATPIETAVFGMPDTYFEDEQAFVKLHSVLDFFGSDVAVGVFRTRADQHRKLGMCRFDVRRLIVEVVDKPEETDLVYAWGVLAWRSTFWHHIRENDPHVGYALPRAIAAGLQVRAVPMEGDYYDCGTQEEYFELVRSFAVVSA